MTTQSFFFSSLSTLTPLSPSFAFLCVYDSHIRIRYVEFFECVLRAAHRQKGAFNIDQLALFLFTYGFLAARATDDAHPPE